MLASFPPMQRRNVLVVLGSGLALALMLLSAADGDGFRRYLKLRAEIEALETRSAQLTQENEAMSRQVEALRSNPVALERAAREELGFIAPGEVVINLE